MPVELIEVEAFVTVARLGGVGRAATALHLSQPAVSRRLDLLERELGAPLFERLRGGVRLTDAGQAFLPYAQQALAALHDGAEAVRELQQEDRGTVTLALVGTLASTHLTGVLRAFRVAHPGIRLLLRTARSDDVGRMVRQGEAHLGLRYFADPHPDLTSQVVADEPLVVVCAAQSELVPEGVVHPEALAGIPWVAFPASGESFTRVLERQLHRWQVEPAEIIAIDSLTAQKRLIEADFGLGLLPESGVTEELRLGTLRRVAVADLDSSAPIVLLQRRQAYLTRAARALTRALRTPW